MVKGNSTGAISAARTQQQQRQQDHHQLWELQQLQQQKRLFCLIFLCISTSLIITVTNIIWQNFLFIECLHTFSVEWSLTSTFKYAINMLHNVIGCLANTGIPLYLLLER
jgi:hypothetical protein